MQPPVGLNKTRWRCLHLLLPASASPLQGTNALSCTHPQRSKQSRWGALHTASACTCTTAGMCMWQLEFCSSTGGAYVLCTHTPAAGVKYA